MKFDLDKSWMKHLGSECEMPYFQKLLAFLENERRKKKVIYPAEEDVFNAFKLTPFSKVKAVIIGQDPYHGEGEAHGLSFSVQPMIKVPPSLKNILKERENDLNFPSPSHGHLESWAKEGVLLLNSVLTVEKDTPGSHQKKGWEEFTLKVIRILNGEKSNVVFILWGAQAANFEKEIDLKNHLVLKAPHPSPLSVYRGFYGSKPFSKTNDYLRSHSIIPIDWSL